MVTSFAVAAEDHCDVVVEFVVALSELDASAEKRGAYRREGKYLLKVQLNPVTLLLFVSLGSS